MVVVGKGPKGDIPYTVQFNMKGDSLMQCVFLLLLWSRQCSVSKNLSESGMADHMQALSIDAIEPQALSIYQRKGRT
jgi:hypothetical protein